MAYPGVVNDVRACFELRPPGRLPVLALGLELDMRVAGVNHEEQRTDVDKAVGGIINAVRRFNYDWGMVFPDDYIEFEPLGLKMRHPPDGPAMAAEYLPLTRGTLRNFRVPDARREMRLEPVPDLVAPPEIDRHTVGLLVLERKENSFA